MDAYRETVDPVPTHVSYGDVVALRSALGVADTDTAATAELSRALLVASRQIDGYCGRTFAHAAARALYDDEELGTYWLGWRALYVLRYPLVSVTSVTRDGVALPYSQRIDSVRVGQGSYPVEGDITVAYAGGYQLPGTALPDLPADLEQACYDIARGIYTRRSRSPDIVSESLAGIADVAFSPTSIPLGTRALLDPYRRILV